MPGFKDYVARDRAVFINPDEFGEICTIRTGNGEEKKFSCVIDSDHFQERAEKFQGTNEGNFLYFTNAENFGTRLPKVGDIQTFNGRLGKVVDVNPCGGMLEITLELNES